MIAEWAECRAFDKPVPALHLRRARRSMRAMRAVVQRVREAQVAVDGEVIGRIGPGLLVLLGVATGDTEADGEWLCGKLARLRIFPDDRGRMNRSLTEVGGEALVVSQFTLFGSVERGNRPSFDGAARPEEAIPLYERVVAQLAVELGRPVPTGRFGADMKVSLVNDGPVTLLLESPRLKPGKGTSGIAQA